MSRAPFVLALDQGTTSSRAIIFDSGAQIVGLAQQEYRQHYPRPGWVEHDAREIWNTQRQVLDQVLQESDLQPSDLAALGITNQRETTILWDRATGKPLHRAIVWQDRRTADFCRQLRKQGHETLFTERTGLRLDPYFSGTKLRWLLDHIPNSRDRAQAGELCFGTVDSWLLWNLTGGPDGGLHATDLTNASRTLLCDIHTGEWDEELLEILQIPAELLPEIRPSSANYGKTKDGIPIGSLVGDQHAALFGQACFAPGLAKNTFGTGCFLLLNTGDQPVASQNNLLTTVAWQIGDKIEYALEGSVFIGGAVIQWLRDELGIISSAEEADELADSVEDSDGLVLVPAFAGLGAPHWDADARGLAIGITRGTSKAHFCRAALEAIAFQTAELVEAMLADSNQTLEELRVDGGASKSNFLMQFQADLLQTRVIRPKITETTALGAALLAGLGTGVWENLDAVAKLWQEDRTWSPQTPANELRAARANWSRAVARAKGWSELDSNEA